MDLTIDRKYFHSIYCLASERMVHSRPYYILGRPANRPAFGGTVPRPAKSWKCPAFCTKSDFFLRAQFVTLPRCSDVNANHQIERNYGNSVRFLAKIPNGTAAKSPFYSVFWNAIDFCRLYTSKENLNVGPANRPAFCRQVPLFYAKCPSKNILQVGRSDWAEW